MGYVVPAGAALALLFVMLLLFLRRLPYVCQ